VKNKQLEMPTRVFVEEKSMNAIPSEFTGLEKDTDVVHETGDDLTEVGAVSETKSGPLGSFSDNGFGWRGPG
jgi:hypothetical protein